MKKFVLLLFLPLVFGCEEKPAELKSNGELTLSSQSFDGSSGIYYRYAYSFDNEKFYKFPQSSQEVIPDVFLLDFPLPPENNLITFLSTETGSQNRIFKNGDFDSLSEAEFFFDSYTQAVDQEWENQSDTLENFQVYTLKTTSDNYVKLLIGDVREVANIGGVNYAEVDIRYFIQRDGTNKLSE